MAKYGKCGSCCFYSKEYCSLHDRDVNMRNGCNNHKTITGLADANEPEYHLKIQIGYDVTAIMSLPCVQGCEKRDNKIIYFLYDWDEFGNTVEVSVGDVLFEDEEGKWYVQHNNQ